MRYLVEYIDPMTGTPRMGTETRLVREYKSRYNVFRYGHYHLRHASFPAGQYRVLEWPEYGTEREIGFLYKRA